MTGSVTGSAQNLTTETQSIANQIPIDTIPSEAASAVEAGKSAVLGLEAKLDASGNQLTNMSNSAVNAMNDTVQSARDKIGEIGDAVQESIPSMELPSLPRFGVLWDNFKVWVSNNWKVVALIAGVIIVAVIVIYMGSITATMKSSLDAVNASSKTVSETVKDIIGVVKK